MQSHDRRRRQYTKKRAPKLAAAGDQPAPALGAALAAKPAEVVLERRRSRPPDLASPMEVDAPEIKRPATTSPKSHLTNVEFHSLPISNASKTAVQTMGFRFMTEVQQRTLPIILQGNDVLARAKTGTGKTVGFLLPAIELIAKDAAGIRMDTNRIQALVLSPTRELATQIAEEARSLCAPHGFHVECVVGGSNMNAERHRLQALGGVQILVATPGRLLDHLKNSAGISVRLSGIKTLILDEADQLLECGFQPDIVRILGYLPPCDFRQTLMFSATTPESIRQVAHLAMRPDFTFVDTVGTDDVHTNNDVEQFVAVGSLDQHLIVLESVLRQHVNEFVEYKVIVFFPTARVVAFCAQLFAQAGMPVLEMHSRKSQPQRTKISQCFREQSKVIMFTSDVSARGVDYPDVSLIIQVGLTTREQYIHRVGRTARAGRKGKAVLLLSTFEQGLLSQLKDLPIRNVSDSAVVAKAMPSANLKKALESVSSSQDLRKAGAQAYQAFLGYYKTSLKVLRVSKNDLVRIANEYAAIIGLKSIPVLDKKTVGKMGLSGVPGLVIK